MVNRKEDAILHLINLHLALIGMATTNDGLGTRATDAALWVRPDNPTPTTSVRAETIRVGASPRIPTNTVSAETVRVAAGSRNPTTSMTAETIRVGASPRLPTNTVSAETVRVAASSRNPTVTMVR